uniref:PHD finger protein ALFIN-LIKE n=1 Tax=Kalanchoe fedtschenkoi TaxID=63787 RepID=A0A7N0VC81_KALFE
MKDGVGEFTSGTIDKIFRDFKGRRTAIIKALTTDVADFYSRCDPGKENLCLYGYPNESWDVNLPVDEVPPEMPEPLLGINFARDGMQQKEWLSLVAARSDSWILSVAFYFGAYFGFDKSDRERLFNMVNDLPTIYDIVTGTVDKQATDKSSVSNHTSKSKSAASEEEEGEDEDGTVCGECNGYYSRDEFWIACDTCDTWYHGKCVKTTAAKAANIKQYKCPSCSTKKPRL